MYTLSIDDMKKHLMEIHEMLEVSYGKDYADAICRMIFAEYIEAVHSSMY